MKFKKEKISSYIWNTYIKSAEVYNRRNISTTTAWRLTTRTTWRKYFDYFVFSIVDYIYVNCGLLRSGARRRALMKLSAMLGASTSTHPWVRTLILKTYDFVDINNATIPTTLGGLTTTPPPIVAVTLWQQLAYLYIIDYGRANDGAPDKS
jgi:hypothetical protein